jgi:hypothetical protein
MYQSFKARVLGRAIGSGECVALVVNNPDSYTAALYPGVNWESIMPPVVGANQLAGKSNQYLTWVENDHNDASQVPSQGDIMVFGPTPEAGYSNQFQNPYGHCGVCDSASVNGYALLQQNAPNSGSPANITTYPWKFRPCLGWYVPLNVGVTPPPPAPVPTPTERTIFLPPTTGPWHLYNDNGPYSPARAKGVLVPSEFGGLTYGIVADRGNGVFVINTQMFGQGALWTNGSDVVIR